MSIKTTFSGFFIVPISKLLSSAFLIFTIRLQSIGIVDKKQKTEGRILKVQYDLLS